MRALPYLFFFALGFFLAASLFRRRAEPSRGGERESLRARDERVEERIASRAVGTESRQQALETVDRVLAGEAGLSSSARERIRLAIEEALENGRRSSFDG